MWEYFNPRSFWAFIFIGYFGFTTLFNNLPSFSKNPSQAQVVIEEVRAGGKQDGKLWSADNFQREEILNMMKDPNVKKITDISDYNFNFNKDN